MTNVVPWMKQELDSGTEVPKPGAYRRFMVWRRWEPTPTSFWDTTTRMILVGAVVGIVASHINVLLPQRSIHANAVAPIQQPKIIPQPQPIATAPAAPAATAPATTVPVPPKPEPKIDTAALVSQGTILVSQGKIIEARVPFEAAAKAGDPEAALSLAATFDPEFLKKARLKHPIKADPERARLWYFIASELRNKK